MAEDAGGGSGGGTGAPEDGGGLEEDPLELEVGGVCGAILSSANWRRLICFEGPFEGAGEDEA